MKKVGILFLLISLVFVFVSGREGGEAGTWEEGRKWLKAKNWRLAMHYENTDKATGEYHVGLQFKKKDKPEQQITVTAKTDLRAIRKIIKIIKILEG